MKNGIKLLLKPGTRIPPWIRKNRNVKTSHSQPARERLRVLIVPGDGTAGFRDDGSVEVRMPGSLSSLAAFAPLTVLEIRDLQGDLIDRNEFLCRNCMTLTGQPAIEVENGHKSDTTLICSHCGRRWVKP